MVHIALHNNLFEIKQNLPIKADEQVKNKQIQAFFALRMCPYITDATAVIAAIAERKTYSKLVPPISIS